MKTATIYTCYSIDSIRFGVKEARCTVDKPIFRHSECVGYAITITIPDGATLSSDSCGTAALITPNDGTSYITYNDYNNRMEFCGMTLEGLKIISKEEI